MLVGAVQAFFEGAMYIFVLQWPPAMIKALAGKQVPFGQVFSCFMVRAAQESSSSPPTPPTHTSRRPAPCVKMMRS